MSALYYCFAILQLTVLSVYSDTPRLEPASANQLVDAILNSLKTTYSRKLEPIAIPTVVESFSKSVLGLRFKGKIELTNGTIHGVSKLYRISDASIGPLPETGEFAASVRLGLDNVEVVSQIMVELNKPPIHKSGSLIVLIGHMDLEANGLLRASNLKPSIEKLKLQKLSGVRVYFTNLGIAGDILQQVSKVVVSFFSDRLRSVVEAQINKAVKNALA